MKISARNVIHGSITSIKEGPVSAEVELSTSAGDRIVAVVTDASVQSLGLAVGKSAIAVVKAPSVTLVEADSGYVFTARNQLRGQVTKVTKGAVNAQVTMRTPAGTTISAIVTNDAVEDLGLAPGVTTVALFKAGQVLLGVAV